MRQPPSFRLAHDRICRVVIDLKHTDAGTELSEIGCWISPWARGAGLAGQGITSAVYVGTSEPGHGTARDPAQPRATPRLGVQRSRVGFHSEGIARSACYTHDGRVDLEVLSHITSDL